MVTELLPCRSRSCLVGKGWALRPMLTWFLAFKVQRGMNVKWRTDAAEEMQGHGVPLVLLLMHFVAPVWFPCFSAGGVVEARVLKIHGELACSTQCCNLCSGSA